MVKTLVEMHGGSVLARSEGLGKGSEFIVRLPLLKLAGLAPAPKAPKAAKKSSSSSEKRMRVLVVEDNVDAAESLAQLLRNAGHDVEVVHDGHAAVETILTKKPEVVLLDIGLPGLDGYQVAEQIQRQGVQPPPHLIAVTGYGSDADMMRAKEVGIDQFIVKPVDPRRLKHMLAMIAEKSA